MQGVPRGLNCYKFIGQQARTSQRRMKAPTRQPFLTHWVRAQHWLSQRALCLQMTKDWRRLHSAASISSALSSNVHQRSWPSVSRKTELVDGRVLLLSRRPGLLKVRLNTHSIRDTWFRSRNSSSQACPRPTGNRISAGRPSWWFFSVHMCEKHWADGGQSCLSAMASGVSGSSASTLVVSHNLKLIYGINVTDFWWKNRGKVSHIWTDCEHVLCGLHWNSPFPCIISLNYSEETQ